RILMISDVVEAAPQGKVKTERIKAFFQMQVERKVIRETMSAWWLDQLLLATDHGEGKTSAKFRGVGSVEAFDQRQQAPGDHAVGSIPRIGPRNLRAQDQIVERIVENLVRSRTRASVRRRHDITFAKWMSQINSQRVKAVLARILECEARALSAVIDKPMDAAAPQELGLEKNLMRKSAFQGNAP